MPSSPSLALTTAHVQRTVAKVYRLRTKALLKLAPEVGLSPPQILLLPQLPVSQQRAILAEKVRERIHHCKLAATCFQRLVRQHTGILLHIPDAQRLVVPVLVAPDPRKSLCHAMHTVLTPPAPAPAPAPTTTFDPRRLLDLYLHLHLLHLPPADRRVVRTSVLRNLQSRRGYMPSPASLITDKRAQALFNVANDLSKKLTGTDVVTLALQKGGSKVMDESKTKLLDLIQQLGQEALSQLPCVTKLRALPVTDIKQLGEFMNALFACMVDFRTLLQKPFDAYCKAAASQNKDECDRLLAQVDKFDTILESVRKVVADLAALNILSAPDFQKMLLPLGPELRKLLA